jgi:hypothetical protein
MLEEIMLLRKPKLLAMTMALALAGCSGGDTVDECVGHAAASNPKCGTPKYGGEILLEALVLPDLTEVTKVTAFVVENVDEQMNRFGAYSNLPNPPPADGTTVCTQYFKDNLNRWPVQDLNMEANEVTIDVGPTMTFSDGAGKDYELSRNANSMDTEGRTHDFVYTYVGDGLPPQKTKFTTTITTGADAYTEVMKGGTYSPADMTWGAPAYSSTGLTIDKTQPITITWGLDEPKASVEGTDHFKLLAIYTLPGGPPKDFNWLCLTEGEQLNIPTDVIATWPANGLFIIGNIAHFQPRGTNGRVMHQIGRFCRVQTFTAQ